MSAHESNKLRSAPRADRQQNNSFDSLRLIGSLMVLFGHAFIITGGEAPRIGTIPIHSFGVCIFFVISGFLITQSWMADSNWRRFMQRRALRIFPALLIVVTVTALVIGALATNEPLIQYYRHGWTWRYIVSNSFLITVWGLPGVFDDLPIAGQANGSLWTLPIEFGLYLLTPLFVALHRRIAGIAPLILLCLSIAVIVAAPEFPGVFRYNLLGIDLGEGLVLAPYFWLGIAMRMMDFGTRPLQQQRWALVVSALVTILWAILANPALLAVGAISISVFVLLLGLTDVLHSRKLGRLGDLSYGTYLWAFPLQQFVMAKAGGGLVLNLAIVAPVTLVLAYLSWHCIERQALRLKPTRRHDLRLTALPA